MSRNCAQGWVDNEIYFYNYGSFGGGTNGFEFRIETSDKSYIYNTENNVNGHYQFSGSKGNGTYIGIKLISYGIVHLSNYSTFHVSCYRYGRAYKYCKIIIRLYLNSNRDGLRDEFTYLGELSSNNGAEGNFNLSLNIDTSYRNLSGYLWVAVLVNGNSHPAGLTQLYMSR